MFTQPGLERVLQAIAALMAVAKPQDPGKQQFDASAAWLEPACIDWQHGACPSACPVSCGGSACTVRALCERPHTSRMPADRWHASRRCLACARRFLQCPATMGSRTGRAISPRNSVALRMACMRWCAAAVRRRRLRWRSGHQCGEGGRARTNCLPASTRHRGRMGWGC